MPAFVYVVTATFTKPALRDSYISWLRGGHTAAVLAAGAATAEIILPDANPPRVQTRYVFPSREAFLQYESWHAPALRAEGLRLFGPVTGTTFSRETGVIL